MRARRRRWNDGGDLRRPRPSALADDQGEAERRELTTLVSGVGFVCSIGFCGQREAAGSKPPDAEDRTSGGVGGVTGAIRYLDPISGVRLKWIPTCAYGMSIFNLHAAVLADYRDFVCSFFTVADERAQALR